MIRVLIADDHALMREGLRRLLSESGDIAVVGEAPTGAVLLDALLTIPADVVVLDVSMPGSRFVELLEELRRRHASIRVIVLSAHAEEEYAVRALKGGAAGYVTKHRSADDLLDAIRTAAAGRRYVSPGVGQLLAEDAARGGRADGALSDREREVLAGLARGRSLKQVAADLGLSVKTVSTYRSRLLEKLGLQTTADLIRYALERRIGPPV